MTPMKFEKWQALGNDYLIVERDELPFELTPTRVRRLCAGHFGVFADGVLLLSPPADPAHVADLRIFNPDGSEAELSGNGAREAILYLRRRGWTDADNFTIHTLAGDVRPTITGPDTCTVDLGNASLTSKDFPGGSQDGLGAVSTPGRTWQLPPRLDRQPPVRDPRRVADGARGARPRNDRPVHRRRPPVPQPHQRLLVHRARCRRRQPPAHIRARIFERGVGETLSSGTGATGAAVAHVLAQRTAGVDVPAERDPTRARVTVLLDGGELEVQVGEDLRVNLTGWARPVFAGRLSEDFEKELHETE